MPYFFSSFYAPQRISSEVNIATLDSLLITLETTPENNKKYTFSKPPTDSKSIQLKHFDPNVATLATLLELGFSPKTAQILINYRHKGGKFKKKSDLKKIYGLSESFYQRLKPYILLPDGYTQYTKGKKSKFSQNKRSFPKSSFNEKNEEKLRFDLNIVDITTLKKIPGIGDVLSQRIIKFRDLLGGFIKVEQVREVYGLKPAVADKLLSCCFLGNTEVQKVNINQATIQELKKHPYISYTIAKAIVNYRQQHGNYDAFEELLHIKIINSEILNKIAPYLSI